MLPDEPTIQGSKEEYEQLLHLSSVTVEDSAVQNAYEEYLKKM
jgi:hypothetical protein